jgi:hypothetical protein
MKFRLRLRFATCVAAALSAYVCAGAMLPGGFGSPLFKKRLQLVASAEAQAQTTSNDALRVQLTALRDSFVDAINAAGFKPSIEPPQIALDNPPSFGRYDSGANLLHIAAWSEIEPDGEGRFARLKSVLNDPRSQEAIFDDSVNHWILIHELGHWWQACQHKEDGEHYALEYGANRIAAAYWRMKDPGYMQHRSEHPAPFTTSSRIRFRPINRSRSFSTITTRGLRARRPTPGFSPEWSSTFPPKIRCRHSSRRCNSRSPRARCRRRSKLSRIVPKSCG